MQLEHGSSYRLDFDSLMFFENLQEIEHSPHKGMNSIVNSC